METSLDLDLEPPCRTCLCLQTVSPLLHGDPQRPQCQEAASHVVQLGSPPLPQAPLLVLAHKSWSLNFQLWELVDVTLVA